MADECTIGPISVAAAHLYDSDDYDNGTEIFEVMCTHMQFRQIQALVERNYSAHGSLGVTICSGTNPWTPTFINTSNTIDYDDDMLIHKGWYIITDAQLSEMVSHIYVKCKITAVKLSSHISEYLTMDYTTGEIDGTALDTTYATTVTTTPLNDTFTTFDTSSTWNAIQYDMAATPTVTATGGSLVFTGRSGTNGQYKAVWTQTQNTYAAPFTLEADMEWSVRASSASTPHILRIIISPRTFSTQSSMNYDSIMIELMSTNNTTYYTAYTNDTSGNVTQIIPKTATSGSIYNHKWKAVFGTSKTVTLSLDTGSGYVQKYYGPHNLSAVSALKMGYTFYNASSTSKTMKTNFITLSKTSQQSNNNIVSMPATATNVVTPTFTRTGEDGAMGCYVDPAVPLTFTTTNTDLGSVKAYSSNNPTTTMRRILNTDEVPVPTGFYVKNGLIKLTTTATGVTLSAWNGSSYTDINTFVIGTINLLKLLEVGPEVVIFQANTTKWIIRRGDPYIYVEHPNDALAYTLKGTYDHDGTTATSPAAGATISMQTVNHCEVYGSGDTYCLQIYKLDPTDIKSDSIPASSLTGLGWYNSTLGTGDYSSKGKLPLQWPIRTEQHISLKQV